MYAQGCPLFGPAGSAFLLALLGPGDGEARVEDAARIERRGRRVDRRERRDRLEVGRIELGREQLADRAVRDPHHPDLVVEHPRLVGDRLDDVVAVEVLQRLEEVEGAARAAGPAHVDVDDREAHEVREDGDAVDRARPGSAYPYPEYSIRVGYGGGSRSARREGVPGGRPGSPAGSVGGCTSMASFVPSRVVRYWYPLSGIVWL